MQELSEGLKAWIIRCLQSLRTNNSGSNSSQAIKSHTKCCDIILDNFQTSYSNEWRCAVNEQSGSHLLKGGRYGPAPCTPPSPPVSLRWGHNSLKTVCWLYALSYLLICGDPLNSQLYPQVNEDFSHNVHAEKEVLSLICVWFLGACFPRVNQVFRLYIEGLPPSLHALHIKSLRPVYPNPRRK